MLQKTNGVVLRSIKYGDTSLVTTIFTSVHGIQTYMVQGVRSAKTRSNRAAFFQPGTLLELVVYQHPQKSMQRIREFQPAYVYSTIQESVIKNSVVLFSSELLLRLLPEHAPLPALFSFAFDYFIDLDKTPTDKVGNFPLFFIIQCSRALGYELKGRYAAQTPHLNMEEGGFSHHPPANLPFVDDADAAILNSLLNATDTNELKQIDMNAAMRTRLIDWYLSFLKLHTEHMGNMKSLPVLKAILHQ
jgi:DNA repair protein RecO (recombination protein O)